MQVRALLVLAIAAALSWAPASVSAAGANSLRAPHVSPTSGTTTTAFSFGVTYAGGSAAHSITVDVAARSIPMALVTGTPTDGTWSATTTLPEGTWSPVFTVFATQGANPSVSGPTVTVDEATLPSSAPTPAITTGPITPPQGDDDREGDAGPASPPPAAPTASHQPGPGVGAPGDPAATGAPASSPTGGGAPTQTGRGAAADPRLADGTTAGAPSQAGEPEGGIGAVASVSSSATPTWVPSVASARSAPRQPDGRPAGAATTLPDDGAFGLLELTVGIGGMAALALFALFMLLASRRRSAAADRPPIGGEARTRVSTAEEQVTATLHQRTLRRSKIRLDEDPIVASMGLDLADGEPARSARRVTRRSPPT